MTDEEKKAWKEVVGSAEYTSKYNLTFDTTTFEGAKLLRDIVHARSILAAAAELTRLRAIVARVEDVEGIITIIALDPDPEVSTRAVSVWIKEG